MSDQEIERGRRWIEGRLHAVAIEFGVTVSDFACRGLPSCLAITLLADSVWFHRRSTH